MFWAGTDFFHQFHSFNWEGCEAWRLHVWGSVGSITNTHSPGHMCAHPPHHRLQYRDRCYYQTVEMVSWLNCSDLCVSSNGTFLESERSMLMVKLTFFFTSVIWTLSRNYTESLIGSFEKDLLASLCMVFLDVPTSARFLFLSPSYLLL